MDKKYDVIDIRYGNPTLPLSSRAISCLRQNLDKFTVGDIIRDSEDIIKELTRHKLSGVGNITRNEILNWVKDLKGVQKDINLAFENGILKNTDSKIKVIKIQKPEKKINKDKLWELSTSIFLRELEMNQEMDIEEVAKSSINIAKTFINEFNKS